MASALNVKVVSADQEIWSGEAVRVIAKTVEGEVGILAGHEPLLAILADKGEVRITLADGEKVVAEACKGFLSVEHNTVSIIAGSATLVA